MLTPKVSFLPMKHLNHRNETIFLRNETICLNYFLYICGMKGHSVCQGGRLCMSGGRLRMLGERLRMRGRKALHDGGISDDSEIGIIASLWLGKNELTNRIVNIKIINKYKTSNFSFSCCSTQLHSLYQRRQYQPGLPGRYSYQAQR